MDRSEAKRIIRNIQTDWLQTEDSLIGDKLCHKCNKPVDLFGSSITEKLPNSTRYYHTKCYDKHKGM